MCFCTWVKVVMILSTAGIWTARRWEGERQVSPPASAIFPEESQQRDIITQINRTFLGCYLSVSRVLFTWMRLLCFFFIAYFLTVWQFLSVPQDQFCSSDLFSVAFSHTSLNATLLAPYYHMSDVFRCIIRTDKVLNCNLNDLHISLLAILLDVEH